MGPAEHGRFWKPREDRQDGTAIVGFISCSTAPNCTDCGDVTRVTPSGDIVQEILAIVREAANGPPREQPDPLDDDMPGG